MSALTKADRENLAAALNLATAIIEIEAEGKYSTIQAFAGRGGTIDHVRQGFQASLSGFTAVSTSSNLQAINNWLFQVKTKARAAGIVVGA